MSTLLRRAAHPLWKVTRSNLPGPQVFHLGKSNPHQFRPQLIRFKVALPCFAQPGNARGALVMARPRFPGQRLRRIAVIEHHMRAIPKTRDKAKRRPDRILAQIRHHSQPGKKTPQPHVKPSRRQSLPQRLPLKINGSKRQRPRYGNLRLSKPLPFPSLRSRMVHFEDPHAIGQSAAVSVGVQSRAENHHLAHAPLNRGSQCILREARPRGDKNSQRASGGPLLSLARNRPRIFPQNTQRQRIEKNAPLLQNLMSRAVCCRTPRRPAWLPQFHEESLPNQPAHSLRALRISSLSSVSNLFRAARRPKFFNHSPLTPPARSGIVTPHL